MAVSKNKKIKSTSKKTCFVNGCDEVLTAVKVIKYEPRFKGMVFQCAKHGKFMSNGHPFTRE